MKIRILTKKTSRLDAPYDNIIKISGHTRHGISRQDVLEAADDNSGQAYGRQNPIELYFPTDRPADASCEIDNFIIVLETWAGEKAERIYQ